MMSFFKRLVSLKTLEKSKLWFSVPINCSSRADKDMIILDAIDFLELNINIK